MSQDSSNYNSSTPPDWSFEPIHDAIKPIQWLIGKWKSIHAEGSFPGTAPFTYCEEITFASFGQPLLNYNSVSWHPTTKRLMHLESGFLRIQAGTRNLAFMVAHNFGVTSIEEGVLVGGNMIKLSSKDLSRMSFAKDPKVTGIERTFELVNNNKLELTVNMQTTDTEMTQHLKVLYQQA